MTDDFLDAMSSSRGMSDYTLEEIEAAEKYKKKHGGSLQDALVEVTGRKASAPRTSAMDLFAQQLDEMQRATEAMMEHRAGSEAAQSSATGDVTERRAGSEAAQSSATGDVTDALQRQIVDNERALNQELQRLGSNLAKDFGIGQTAETGTADGQARAAGNAAVAGSAELQHKASEAELSGASALEAFAGVEDVVRESVYGQDGFIRKLLIAMKRPYVMPPEGKRADNTILLTGGEDTGKHYALEAVLAELAKRRILRTDKIQTVDLGIYTDASMEKLFLQDIYEALASDARVVLFEHLESCHPSFLAQVSALVTEGSFGLSERYVLQKGQLVNVQSSLASEAVGALDAGGKYLVFVTNRSVDKTAGLMGAPFIDALGDICETAPLDEAAIRKVAERELGDLRARAERQFFFLLRFDEGFLDYSVSRAGRQAGIKGVRNFYNQVLQALAQAKLEGDYARETRMELRVEDGRLIARVEGAASGEARPEHGDDTEIDLSALLPGGYRGEVEEIRRELDAIVGLREIKEYILGLEEYYAVQKRREEEGLQTAAVSKHMIFTGSPGTGKTTIARIISKYLKAIGVLSGGQLVEVSRADLVGRYVGHTAPLTQKVIGQAIGGVLFIDEAYSLYRGKDDSFGLEAIDTLVKGIEDNRDNLIVILAGYSIEMEEFLTSNSGLKSRFPNVIHFPDYTGEELLQISRSIARSKGYTIDEAADAALTEYFDGVQLLSAADAGNGRLARNMVEEAILNQSRRLVAEPEAELSTLLLADFQLGETDAAGECKE